MDSSSGNSLQNAGPKTDLMSQRKRKRMESNRESARRSRMRKQNRLDELMAEINKLKINNSQIITTMKNTTHQFVQIEADNSVFRAQIGELSQRLDSLNEIIDNSVNCTSGIVEFEQSGFFNDPWSLMYLNQQVIMASAANMCRY